MSDTLSINYDTVIMKLKQHCPIFCGRVRYAVDLASGVDANNRFQPPAAYVGLTGMRFEENGEQIGLVQATAEEFSVWIEVDVEQAIEGDRSGYHGATMFWRSIYPEVVRALVNWNPLPERSSFPIEIVAVENLDANPKRQIWVLDFQLRYWITQDDGWQNPEYDFDGIDGYVQEPSNANVITNTFDVTFDSNQQGGPVIGPPTPNW